MVTSNLYDRVRYESRMEDLIFTAFKIIKGKVRTIQLISYQTDFEMDSF